MLRQNLGLQLGRVELGLEYFIPDLSPWICRPNLTRPNIGMQKSNPKRRNAGFLQVRPRFIRTYRPGFRNLTAAGL